jgi:hypothetical protein
VSELSALGNPRIFEDLELKSRGLPRAASTATQKAAKPLQITGERFYFSSMAFDLWSLSKVRRNTGFPEA